MRGGAVYGEQMNRREFLVRMLGLGGIAATSLVVVAGCGGEEEDDEEEDDD